MCGFLRGKPHAVRWPHKAPQEIRVPRISCSAALVERSDVRLSSRKAACSSVAPQSPTGNPGSVCSNCETALAHLHQDVLDCRQSVFGSIEEVGEEIKGVGIVAGCRRELELP